MKTYTFWVTMEGKGPMKVAEDGRTASEAKQIVESRFPGARVVFAEGFQMILLIMSRVFLIGACYGFWLNDSMVIKTVGVLLAIGFVLDLIYQTTKDERVDRYQTYVKIN